MESYTIITIKKEPIHQIIKSNLVQYANKTLPTESIDTIADQIIETIESFVNNELSRYNDIA